MNRSVDVLYQYDLILKKIRLIGQLLIFFMKVAQVPLCLCKNISLVKDCKSLQDCRSLKLLVFQNLLMFLRYLHHFIFL